MASNFPSSLDNATTLPVEAANTPLSTNHVTAHQNIQDALEAVEAKIGVDSSAVTTSHDYKLSLVTTTDKALPRDAAATTTNKILGTGTAITLGSDAEGDTYYRTSGNVLARLPRGSDNQILKMNGNVPNWEAETVTVDATSTTAGIVELATAAEITAGTATGGDGPLVVTPDQLAASTPVFNGGSITNITRLLNTVTTDVTYSSSTAENTLLSYSVPGGTLSTGNVIRVTMHVSGLGVTGSNTWTLRFKYGATTLATKVYTNVSGNNTFVGKMEFLLAGAGSTSSQNGSYSLNLGNANYIANAALLQAMMFSESAQGTSAIDSTSSQTLAITSQHSNSGGSDNITVSIITTEVLR
jgi:hypothetical protein